MIGKNYIIHHQIYSKHVCYSREGKKMQQRVILRNAQLLDKWKVGKGKGKTPVSLKA